MTAASSPELFSVPTSLSPRLLWMRELGITTRETTIQVLKDAVIAEDGKESATADNEEAACIALAIKRGIRLWNGA